MERTLPKLLKHALVTAVLVAASAIPAHAEDDSVIILAKDGTSFTAKIADVKRIDLGTDNLELSTGDGNSVSYSYSDVDRIMIGATPAGIADITGNGDIAIWPTAVTSTLHIAGAEAGTPVMVYGINGTLVASATAGNSTLSLDISAAQPGVCIVNVGTKTVKIIKK